MKRHTSQFSRLLLLLLLLLPTACGQVRDSQRPTARAWLITDSASVLAALPKVGPTAPTPPPADSAAPATWAQPASVWMQLELEMIKREYTTPPRAARGLALLAVGMNDGLLVADAARTQGISVSDDALLAAVARSILTYNHPIGAERYAAQADTAAWFGVWRGKDTPQAVASGLQIGTQVAETVLRFARQDGADEYVEFQMPAPVPGTWQPTPPDYWYRPIEPGWGQVTPIGFAEPLPAVAPPPAWDSPVFQADREAFAEAQRQLTDADKALAKQWAGGIGTVTPPGLWVEIAYNLIDRERLDVREATRVYAALTVAMHDAFIACWAGKYQYLVARPIQWMHESDPAWKPVVVTPPFPSYPSGHAAISGAASVVLAAFFSTDAAQLYQQAEDASRSRVVGGIHWSMDSHAGLDLGRRIGQRLLAPVSVARLSS